MQFRRPSRPEVAINIAPLVDVVFLLVIFFAVSTTFLDTAGLQLDLPRSSSTTEQSSREVTVALRADGRAVFEGQEYAIDALREPLTRALTGRERKEVTLRADAATRHGDVVQLMDAIRAAGATGMTVAARSDGP